MTPRERWLAVLKRQKPDRIPMDYWATPEASFRLMKYVGCVNKRELLERLHVDFVVKLRPSYIGPKIPKGQDVFGCKYMGVDYGSGVYKECVYHPLAEFNSVEEIKSNYTWPRPDWWDFSKIEMQLKGNEMYPTVGGKHEPFLCYRKLRGETQGYMDIIKNPEIVHYCLDKLFHLSYEKTSRLYEQIPGSVMLTNISEDMGGQNDLLFSPAHIREFLIPRMKLMIDLAHEAGAYVFHHNDGSIHPIIPDLIEIGIDILNPIQWRSKGMKREWLKREFGDDVIFHGGMDNQYTLCFGTTKEVKQEVLDNLRILGEDGGYIFAPCHNIQAASPPENIVAMYETCYQNGWM
ncbi:MAG: uroporphyrinogen-III decarboxylase-like protein [Candidatus Aminicenantes bacterium]|nr:MAG: uroporphyrinogen-III decarboxylase-like protein [Candidatus Aminicenantes bacterium]